MGKIIIIITITTTMVIIILTGNVFEMKSVSRRKEQIKTGIIIKNYYRTNVTPIEL